MGNGYEILAIANVALQLGFPNPAEAELSRSSSNEMSYCRSRVCLQHDLDHSEAAEAVNITPYSSKSLARRALRHELAGSGHRLGYGTTAPGGVRDHRTSASSGGLSRSWRDCQGTSHRRHAQVSASGGTIALSAVGLGNARPKLGEIRSRQCYV
jgi:hypothetical protein